MMKKQLFNRILRLLEERPQQGKRMIGLGAVALWELWQRIAALDAAAKQAQAHRPGRKRQSGGGRKKGCRSPLSVIGGAVVLTAALDDASDSRIYWQL